MVAKTAKTLMMIALVLAGLTLVAGVSSGKARTAVHVSDSVQASAVVPPGDWSQTYGGSGDEYAQSVVQASDGGYALAGFTDSSGAGGFDFYLVKTDSAGNQNWTQTYGGSGDDFAYSLVKTSDGGYALAGYTDSSGAGGNDFYLAKTDSAGASSSSGGFNWSSVTGYVIIAAIIIIIIAAALLFLSRIGDRKGKPQA